MVVEHSTVDMCPPPALMIFMLQLGLAAHVALAKAMHIAVAGAVWASVLATWSARAEIDID